MCVALSKSLQFWIAIIFPILIFWQGKYSTILCGPLRIYHLILRLLWSKMFLWYHQVNSCSFFVHENSSQLSHHHTLQNQPFKRTHMTIFIYKGNNFIWPATTCIVDVWRTVILHLNSRTCKVSHHQYDNFVKSGHSLVLCPGFLHKRHITGRIVSRSA